MHSPHQFRFAAVPLRVDGTGSLSEDVNFNGQTFLKGVPTKGTYRFDTYRFTYRYMFHNAEKWKWNVGGTLLIRDAEIRLEQAGGPGRAFDFALQGIYALSDRWDLGLGYRTIEGGSDVDEVYSFAWFNAVNVIVTCKF